jgi:hypothetical protein
MHSAAARRGSPIAPTAGRMSGYSSAHPETPSEFRVQKSRADATLTLSNGTSVHGCFFISGNSRTHAGPEGVKDVLNTETGFFPFDSTRPDGSTTILVNRDHVVCVKLEDKDEPRRDPDYDVATQKIVTMLMSNGTRLRGSVRISRPHGSDRLSDFARGPEAFRYLETDAATYIINVHHLVELTEEPLSS